MNWWLIFWATIYTTWFSMSMTYMLLGYSEEWGITPYRKETSFEVKPYTGFDPEHTTFPKDKTTNERITMHLQNPDTKHECRIHWEGSDLGKIMEKYPEGSGNVTVLYHWGEYDSNPGYYKTTCFMLTPEVKASAENGAISLMACVGIPVLVVVVIILIAICNAVANLCSRLYDSGKKFTVSMSTRASDSVSAACTAVSGFPSRAFAAIQILFARQTHPTSATDNIATNATTEGGDVESGLPRSSSAESVEPVDVTIVTSAEESVYPPSSDKDSDTTRTTSAASFITVGLTTPDPSGGVDGLPGSGGPALPMNHPDLNPV